MIVHDMAQRSDAWREIRLGKLTGSCAADMLATIKSGEAAARRDLRVRLIVERLTGRSAESGFVNAEMEWGITHEAEAMAAYEAQTCQLIAPVGFVAHDTLPAGCSPDGWTPDHAGLVSIKCPKSTTHWKYLRAAGLPADYLPQVLHETWITGAKWTDFVSYDPRFPEHLQLLVVRVEPTPDVIAAYAEKAEAFLREVDTEEAAMRGWSMAVPA